MALQPPIPWVAITQQTLLDRALSPLVSALQSAALASGQSDPTPALILSATAHIRTAIASKQTNRLDLDNTKIPPSLLDLGVRIIYRALMGRLRRALNADEIRVEGTDIRYLERIEEGIVTIETSDNAATAAVESASGVSVVRPGQQRFGHHNLSGL